MTSLVLKAGHSSTRAAVFRPDGRVLATCGNQEVGIHFWRVRDGSLLGIFSGHPRVSRFALSQNRLLTYGDGQVRLWRTSGMDEEGFQFPMLCEYAANTEKLVLTSRHFLFRQAGFQVALGDSQDGKISHTFPEGRWFYTGARGRRILLGGEKSQLFSGVSGRKVADLEVGCALAAFSPEDRWLACAGSHDLKVTLMDAETLKSWPIEGHGKRVLAGNFSMDGLWFASVAEDASLCILNLEDWQMTTTQTLVGRAEMLLWISGGRLVLGNNAGQYQVFGVTRGGVRAGTLQTAAAAHQTEAASGSWSTGPDSLAAWAPAGLAVQLVQLSESTPRSQLPPPLWPQPQVPQQVVGQAVLVAGRVWSLQDGRPLRLDREYHCLSGFPISRRGAQFEMLDGFRFQAPPGNRLLAVDPQARRFAFYEAESRRLEVMQRDGKSLKSWRTLEPDWEGAALPEVYFSPCASHLAVLVAPSILRVWVLESNRCQAVAGKPLFLPQGEWVNPGPEGLELWNAGGERVECPLWADKPLGLLLSPTGFVVVLRQGGVQKLSLDLQQQIGSLLVPDLFQAWVSDDGLWLAVLRRDARISLWALPSGQRLGEPRAFDPNELKTLSLRMGHGWMVARAGNQCGCWHLGTGSFEWMKIPEPWPESIYPLPGGRLLLLTQDGAWHLYAGPPLRRVATLKTAVNGDWVVFAASGRWDSSPGMKLRVGEVNGASVEPASTDRRQESLWSALLA